MLTAVLFFALVAVADEPAESEIPPAVIASDRGLLMKCLQGTYPGWLLDGHRIRVSGWIDGSFTASSADPQQLPMGFNYRANEFLLQQNWLRVERAVDTSAAVPTFGFRSDTILPGSDYRFTIARGLCDWQLTADDGQPNRYGIDPVQFYTEAYFPHVCHGLDVKVGRFFSPYGVESIDATQNPLPSRSYTFIYDPFTHTGVVTSLQLTRDWSVQNGLVLGSDVFIDPADSPTYIGGFKWAPPDGRTSVSFLTILGSGRYNVGEDFNNPQIFDLVVTHQLTDRCVATLEALFGRQDNVPELGSVTWWGLVNYLTYQITPRLSTTGRLEFFNDADGNRTGFEGLYSVVTAGLNYQPCQALMVRPELRFDNNSDSRPFEGQHNLFTATLDVVFRW